MGQTCWSGLWSHLKAQLGLEGPYEDCSCDSWQETAVPHWPLAEGTSSSPPGLFHQHMADIAAGFAPEQVTQERVTKREAKCVLQAYLENDIPSLLPYTIS